MTEAARPAVASRIGATIDLDAPGRHAGFLKVPHSTHESAYGWIPVPIVTLANGEGPTVLLMAGNHGDEYEGQVALCNLVRALTPEDVRGRLIVLPAVNFPAAHAGRRTSPLDGGNLNRSFPGDPDGGPTSMIAHYVDSVLLPRCDYAADLHSGGSSLAYTPCALGNLFDDMPQRNATVLELLDVFGAPVSYVARRPMGADRAFGASARRRGVVAIGTEAGGGGTLSARALGMVERGLRRVLRHVGVAPGLAVEPGRGTRIVEVGGADHFVYATERGLYEPLVEPGDEVERGQPAARIHFPDTPWREPETVHFERAGLVLCKRVPARTERGDCLFHLGSAFGRDPAGGGAVGR
jgi:predicted deacylase